MHTLDLSSKPQKNINYNEKTLIPKLEKRYLSHNRHTDYWIQVPRDEKKKRGENGAKSRLVGQFLT